MNASGRWLVEIRPLPGESRHGGAAADREALCGWLWEAWGAAGLLGIDEGTLDTADAARLGLIPSERVIDAGPRGDRDWMASLPTAALTCWFVDRQAAQAAAAELAAAGRGRVTGVRPEPPHHPDWRHGFGAVAVAGFGEIRPAWEAGEAGTRAGGTTVFVEPGAGFGTGLHETTRLCLTALATWQAAGGGLARVLDFGSGSGILGIAAAVRGGLEVDAVEIDPRVHPAIRANAQRNGVADRVRVTAELPATGGYDLVFANIVASVLLDHADRIVARVGRAPGAGGCLVLSGLLESDVAAVAGRFGDRLGCRPQRTVAGEWRCLRFVTGGPHEAATITTAACGEPAPRNRTAPPAG